MAEEPLSAERIEENLKKLNVEWAEIDGAKLERVYELDDFTAAKKLVDNISRLAEAENHHPELWFTWGKVVITITTHSAHGLTEKDFVLAKKIDELG